MSCAHTGCRCQDAPTQVGGTAYCSDECAADQQAGRTGTCSCNHEECLVRPLTPPPGGISGGSSGQPTSLGTDAGGTDAGGTDAGVKDSREPKPRIT